MADSFYQISRRIGAIFGSRLSQSVLLVGALVCSLATVASGQRPGASAAAPAGDGAVAEEIAALERKIEAAVLKGDFAFLTTVTPDDFRFTHGDGWIVGKPSLVQNRAEWFDFIKTGRHFLTRDVHSIAVEMHGNVALTNGVLHSTFSPGEGGKFDVPKGKKREYDAYYIHAYERRNGKWLLLTHRTVRGPVYLDATAQ